MEKKPREERRIQLKMSDDEPGTFTGLLSPYNEIDEVGDIVRPGAYKRTIKANNGVIPLLWQHDSKEPIGKLQLLDKEDGLYVRGSIILDDSVPNGKKAYTLMKHEVVDGLSIGFQPTVAPVDEKGIRNINEAKLFEGSVVTFPAALSARISSVKSIGDGTSDFSEELEEQQAGCAGFQIIQTLEQALYRAWWNCSYDDDGDLAEDMPSILSYVEAMFDDAKEEFLAAIAKWGNMMADSEDEDEAKSLMLAVKTRVMEMQRKAYYKGSGKTKRVAGEDLPASAFLIVGDSQDTSTWKLPVKFSDDAKTKCLVGETPIPLMDGTTKPIRDVKEGDWVYSFDVTRRTVAPGRVQASVLSGAKVPIVRVTLDNGEKIECTGNHPFLLLTGSYRNASELSPGDSLMPLYRTERAMWRGKGERKRNVYYECVFQPWYGTWEFTHRLSHREAKNTPLFPGNHVHHVNENHRDNTPDNLEQLTRSEHMKKHSQSCEWWGGSAASLAKASEARWSKPGASARQSGVIRRENERRRRAGVSYKLVVENVDALFIRYISGEAMTSLAKEIGVSGHTLSRAFRDIGKERYAEERAMADEAKIRELHEAFMLGESVSSISRRTGFTRNTITRKFEALESSAMNHKVISVEDAGLADVYDLQIEKHANFAVEQGVFVHNSHIRNALARINQVQGVSSADLAAAKKKLAKLAKQHGIDSGDDGKSLPNIETKAGRTISAKTAELLQGHAESIKSAMGTLGDVADGLSALYNLDGVVEDSSSEEDAGGGSKSAETEAKDPEPAMEIHSFAETLKSLKTLFEISNSN